MSSIISPLSHANASENFKSPPTAIKNIESSLPSPITNFNLITDTDKELEYTYNEDGKKYKIIEKFNADQTSVDSTIYEFNKSTGQYTIIDQLVTSLNEENNSVESSSLITGETNIIKLEELLSDNPVEPILDSDITALSNYDWEYKNTYYGDNTFSRITVAIIAIAISSITKLPSTAKAVTNAANAVFQIGVGKIYYIKHTYQDRNSNKLRPRIKTVTHIYSDSNRKNLIRGHITNIYSR